MLCFQEMVGAVDLPQHASLLCYLLKFTFVIQHVLNTLIFCIDFPNMSSVAWTVILRVIWFGDHIATES